MTVPRRALVTGASGFLGGHLLEELARNSVAVATLGRSGVEQHPHYAAEVDDTGAICSALDEFAPDVVFHLAASANAGPLIESLRVNVLFAAAILTASCGVPQRRFRLVLIGSAAEYGRVPADLLPVDESFACRPLTSYGIGKLTQTLLGLEAAGEGRDVVIARLANLVGPGMSQRSNLGSFAHQLAAIELGSAPPVLTVGALDTVRDYVDVRDATKLLWSLASCEAAKGELVNIATGVGTTTQQLLDLALRQSGCDPRIQFDPSRLAAPGVPAHVGDPAKLNRLLGSATLRPLSESVAAVLEDARRQRREVKAR